MAKRIRNQMGTRISVHDSVQEMYERIHNEGLSNTFDRFTPRKRSAVHTAWQV
ncbi:hypothetical protein MCACP_01550 [Neomoorella carbonis]